MTDPTLFERAQQYAERGYFCIPADVRLDENGDKRVKFPDEYKGVVFDQPEQWEGFTGLAINTAMSGIVVIDIDKGSGKDGWAGLREAGITPDETPMKAWSQSGGEHWFYRKTSIPVDQSSGLLAQDVDVRGDASGVLFAYPTVVANGGGQYTFQDPGVVPVDKLPEFSTELAQLLRERSGKAKRTLPLPPATPPEDVSAEQRERLMRVVEFKLGDLRDAPPGGRFDATKAVMRIIGIGKALGNADELAERVRQVFPGDEDQIDDSIDRAIRAADPEVLPDDDARGFWDQRPELAHIRQAAYSRYLSPWAVLGGVLVRVLGDVHPTCHIDGGQGEGNLNLFTVITGPSGSGKGQAIGASAALWPSHAYHSAPCSGEALPNLFVRKARDEEGQWTDQRIRDSVIIQSPEFAATSASANRQGSTLIPQLCSGFSSENLAFTKADPAKNFDQELVSYRLGLIAGIQDGNAYMLLSDGMTTTGLAQRVIWMPAQDSDVPRSKPKWPGVLKQHGVRSLPAGHTAVACEAAHAEIDQDHYDRSRPGNQVDPLDGHKFYIRLKVAYALALLNGHWESIRDEDWELAGIVMYTSDDTRRVMLDAMTERDRKRQEAAGKRDGQRRSAADYTADEESIKRAADTIERWLRKKPTGGTQRDLTHSLRSNTREYFDDAIELLVSEGRVLDRGDNWYVAA